MLDVFCCDRKKKKLKKKKKKSLSTAVSFFWKLRYKLANFSGQVVVSVSFKALIFLISVDVCLASQTLLSLSANLGSLLWQTIFVANLCKWKTSSYTKPWNTLMFSFFIFNEYLLLLKEIKIVKAKHMFSPNQFFLLKILIFSVHALIHYQC